MISKYKKRGKKRTGLVIGLVVGIIVIALFCCFAYINSRLDQIKINPINSGVANATKTDTGVDLLSDRDVLNVLLIGSDSRAGEAGRSDSMILLSINKKTKKIIMTSLMRDMYVKIKGHGNEKINAAFSHGGVSLLINTIQNNFLVKIDQYVTVDFFGFIKIVDELGGIRINVTSAERPVLNNYIKEINKLKHLPASDGLLESSGDRLLTGKQALGYSRIRYIGNSDFQRTERQRTVLNQIISKVKKQNTFKQLSLVNELLPDVTTSFTKGQLVGLIYHSLEYKKYAVVQDRIPVEGSYQDAWAGGQEVLKVNLPKNIQELKSKIYGE